MKLEVVIGGMNNYGRPYTHRPQSKGQLYHGPLSEGNAVVNRQYYIGARDVYNNFGSLPDGKLIEIMAPKFLPNINAMETIEWHR